MKTHAYVSKGAYERLKDELFKTRTAHEETAQLYHAALARISACEDAGLGSIEQVVAELQAIVELVCPNDEGEDSIAERTRQRIACGDRAEKARDALAAALVCITWNEDIEASVRLIVAHVLDAHAPGWRG